MQRAVLATFAAAAAAAPLNARQAQPAAPEGGDITILQYALTLEHLENAFYMEALERFNPEDFEAVGLGRDFYNNVEQIQLDEASHAEFLSAAISANGGTPVQPCQYDFGVADVPGFLALANVLEGVGVSAYSGAAGVVAEPAFLTAAATILTVEARHSAYIRNGQLPPQSPFPSPYDTPLSFGQVFSLAAPFIVPGSCPGEPNSETAFGITPFPALATDVEGIAQNGDIINLTFESETEPTEAYFITFPGGPNPLELSGVQQGPLLAAGSPPQYSVEVPDGLAGQAYLVLTSGGAPTDDNTVAGPAVFQIADNAADFQAANPDFVYSTENCDKVGAKPPAQPEQPGKYPPKSPEQPPRAPEAPKYPVKDAPKQPGKFDTRRTLIDLDL